MAKQWGGGGIYVKSLFKLLAYLGVSQTQVGQHLGLKKPQISLWANGRRPMSLRYRERYCQLLRANMATTPWVCAILDDGGLWHHLRGITRRETSGDHVNTSRPSRKEQGRPGHGGAGIGGEAHHLFPSSRMAQTQGVVAMFGQCATNPAEEWLRDLRTR
jgi:transcriptional regulator with XRE-family HTH domain